ncbi:hypothetical protein B5X24_HaOG211478 [Helicoverpa armigera]|nr:hypothetical protein B5X24_HaOG211478 [Helicoverpa armigera]
MRSCREHVSGHSGHAMRWDMVCIAAPHSHPRSAPPVKPHLDRLSLVRPTCVRSLFKDCQTLLRRSCPGGSLSKSGTNGVGSEILDRQSSRLAREASPSTGATIL